MARPRENPNFQLRLAAGVIVGLLIVAFGLLTLTWHCNSTNEPEPNDAPLKRNPGDRLSDYDSLLLNQIFQKSSHNSYEQEIALKEQLEMRFLRSVELDIQEFVNEDWMVFHDSCDRKTSVSMLSDGLRAIAQYHQENPHHQILSLFLDIKWDALRGEGTPQFLDELLEKHLGDALFKPQHLLEKISSKKPYQTLHHAIRIKKWPTLGFLKGRIMVYVTGYIGKYSSDAHKRVAFLTKSISKPDDILSHKEVIMFNLKFHHTNLSRQIRKEVCFSRRLASALISFP